jgi:hypothetical protein
MANARAHSQINATHDDGLAAGPLPSARGLGISPFVSITRSFTLTAT